MGSGDRQFPSDGEHMFCPQCGSENEFSQSYCRRCGRSLEAVQLGLDRHLDQARQSLGQARKPLLGGLIALAAFAIITFLTLFTGGRVGWGNPFSAIAFFALTVPFVIIGVVRFVRGIQLLNSRSRSLRGKESTEVLTSGTSQLNSQAHSAAATISATEETTQELQSTRRVVK